MNLQNFIRDIQFVEDRDKVLLYKLNQAKGLFQELAGSEGSLSGIFVEDLIYDSTRLPNNDRLYDNVRKEVSHIPTIISYNGAIYQASIDSKRNYIKQGDNINNLDMHYVKLTRIIGLDNDARTLTDVVRQLGRLESFNNEDKKILLSIVISPYSNNTPLITQGDVELLVQSQRFETVRDGDIMHHTVTNLIRRANGYKEYTHEELDSQRISTINLSNNLIEELTNAEDSYGNSIYAGILTVNLEDLDYYTHTIYNYLTTKYGKEYAINDTSTQRPVIGLSNGQRDRHSALNLKINKRRLVELEDEDKEFILSIIKKGIVKHEGTNYTYDSKNDKFISEGLTFDGYVSGIKPEAVMGENIKPHSNKFHKGFYLAITNVWRRYETRDVIMWDNHRPINRYTGEKAMIVSSNTLYVYTNTEGTLTNLVGFSSKDNKRVGYEEFARGDAEYILKDRELYQHYNVRTGEGRYRVVGVKLPKKMTSIGIEATELRDIQLPLEVGLFRKVQAYELSKSLIRRAEMEGDLVVRDLITTLVPRQERRGIQPYNPDLVAQPEGLHKEDNSIYNLNELYHKYFVDYPNLRTYKDFYEGEYRSIWERIYYTVELFKVDNRGKEDFSKLLSEGAGVNTFNIYQDKDFTGSPIYN